MLLLSAEENRRGPPSWAAEVLPEWTALQLCAFSCSHALHSSGYKASYLDVGGSRHSGTLAGLGNTVASVASYLGPRLAGVVLSSAGVHDAGAWRTIFAMTALVNVAGACVFFFLVDDQRIVVESAKKRQ